jgi:hypothetical protein
MELVDRRQSTCTQLRKLPVGWEPPPYRRRRHGAPPEPPPRLQLQEEEEERVWRTKKALAAPLPKCGCWLRHRTHGCKRKGERDQFSSSGLANNKGQRFIVHIWQMTLSRCYNEEGCFHTKLTPVRTENGWVNRGRFDTFFLC